MLLYNFGIVDITTADIDLSVFMIIIVVGVFLGCSDIVAVVIETVGVLVVA